MCDRTGFKVRARETVKEWTGRIVRTESSEPRNAQDFVRGVQDYQSVPDARSRQVDFFLGPLGTTLTINAAAGVTALVVDSSIRMATNDLLSILLDDGTFAFSLIQSIPSATQINLVTKLPFKASSGNAVVDYTALSLANIG